MAGNHVLHVFQPTTGGVPTYVAGLVEGLTRRGWQVSVACPQTTIASARITASGAEVFPVELARRPDPVRDARAILRIAAFCRERDVTLVHGHSSKGGFISALTGRLAGITSLYTPHGWSFEMRKPFPARALYAAAELLLARCCHRLVVAVAEGERSAAERWHVTTPGSVRVVHTGIESFSTPPRREAARAALGIPDEAVVAAWVGRCHESKRPQDLAALAERLGGERLVIVALGEGLAGSSEGVALAEVGGMIAPAQLGAATVYAASDIAIQTSAWEGLPMTVLEAMGAALPVVAYDVGGLREQVEDGSTGFLVPRSDIDALADRVRLLATQPRRRVNMGSAGRARLLERFDYDHMVESIEEIYRLAARRPAPQKGRAWES